MLLLRLPAFWLAVWLMYWSLPLGVLTLYIPVWQLWGARNDTFYWVKFLVTALGIKFRKRGSGELYSGQAPCIYLANHRSWADFFVDAYLAGGRAQMLSRMAVLYAFPMFMAPVIAMRGCIVFKRGRIDDKEAFNKWIDGLVEASPQNGLMVYPEGHRSTLAHSLPLKRGMLHYAYSRKMPVQIIMSANKESVLSEKELHVGFGCTVVTSYSGLISPGDYAGFEGFMAAVQAAWDKEWRDTMSADAAGLPPLHVSGTIDDNHYPPRLVVSQLFFSLLGITLLFAASSITWGWILRAKGVLGPQGAKMVVSFLVAWFAASLAYCYNGQLPKPRLLPDGSEANGGGAGWKAGGRPGGGAAAKGGALKAAAAGGGGGGSPKKSS
ncbi:phospholipid glycerol acyltransferase [Raphidocelis subcapitata]|uniref:Phospholipid glycerol acyltransferase n=1 Tax=Raphidocelis subcapitata TaxID=307507 RepID=A0A2V0P7Y7_9CHLO|nr:phospholipid glycerol acyltransferase [Raphidocelis subcapitata]|eukprot:GBF93205.1 phospholipid glycerol acyltransferase [Raphidocelis subcapitata]